MRPVKVLHLIKTLDLGGAELNLFNLVRATSPEDVDCHVGYSSGGLIEEMFRKEGAKLFKFAEGFHKVKSLASIVIICRIIKYIRAHEIDIVHTHNFSAHAWGAVAAKLAGVKLVEHVHDLRYEESGLLVRNRIKASHYRLSWFFAKFSDVIIVLTEGNKRFLTERGICPEEKIRVMLNGIPLDGAPPADTSGIRKRIGVPEDARIVLSAGRISFEKNMGMVLDIASSLKGKYTGVVFVIAGDGPLKEDLERSASEKGLDKEVRFIGFYPDIPELLGIAELFLLPSFLELHSITMLEAMSMRVPALVSRGAGCNDDFITDGVNGLLLETDNADRWCEAVSRLLDDPHLAKNIADKGRELVEKRCDIKDTVKAIEGVYSDLCGARGEN